MDQFFTLNPVRVQIRKVCVWRWHFWYQRGGCGIKKHAVLWKPCIKVVWKPDFHPQKRFFGCTTCNLLSIPNNIVIVRLYIQRNVKKAPARSQTQFFSPLLFPSPTSTDQAATSRRSSMAVSPSLLPALNNAGRKQKLEYPSGKLNVIVSYQD